jgi:hypothetical protein
MTGTLAVVGGAGGCHARLWMEVSGHCPRDLLPASRNLGQCLGAGTHLPPRLAVSAGDRPCRRAMAAGLVSAEPAASESMTMWASL